MPKEFRNPHKENFVGKTISRADIFGNVIKLKFDDGTDAEICSVEQNSNTYSLSTNLKLFAKREFRDGDKVTFPGRLINSENSDATYTGTVIGLPTEKARADGFDDLVYVEVLYLSKLEVFIINKNMVSLNED